MDNKIIKQEPKLLRLEDVSRLYSLPLTTLRRWAAERRFPLYKVSNRVRVSPREFSDWLETFHIKGGEK